MNTVRLEQFEKKHAEWVCWLNGDDPHSIWKQISSLLWDYSLFQTIYELRKDAAQNPTEKVGFNMPVLRLFDAGFVVTQAAGIRRLTEKQWKDSSKRVISLRALVDDIRIQRELLTREVYVGHQSLPFDPAPVKKKFMDAIAASGQTFSFVGMDTKGPEAWRASERAHECFDKLAGSSAVGRSREDLVSLKWFDLLDAKIKSCEDVCVFTDKFIAHAADPTSRTALNETQTGVTLSGLKACHKAVAEVTAFVAGQLLQDSASTLVPVPQFDLLENLDKPWVVGDGLERGRIFWHRHCEEVEKWAGASLLDS